MGYVPNIQFAPWYVAVDRGYLEQQGIEVQFDYKYENDGVALVGAGTVPFAIASGEQILLARAQGLPVVYVLGWFQNYAVAVIAKSEEHITQPADLKGKKIGLPCLCGASYIGLDALLASAGLKESDVHLDTIGYNQIAALTAGRDDAVVGYTNNEPLQLRASGIAVDVLPVAQYVQLASNGLITNETTLRTDPDLVRRMAHAFLHGLQDTVADPAAAYAISEKYVPGLSSEDASTQRQILAASIDLWKAPRPGWSNPQAWETMQATLVRMGQIRQPLDLSQAFTNEFIP
jgi:NitT/TauT family transport system substrate-binding protein